MSLDRRQLVLSAMLIVTVACAPANERPLRGAQPGTPVPTPPGVPPTLTASEALRQRALPSVVATQPQPSPGVAASPSPQPAPSSPSPQPAASVVAAPPIVRTIVPGA